MTGMLRRFAMCLAAPLLIAGCGSPAPTAVIDSASARRLCVVQVHSDRIEIIPLEGTGRLRSSYQIPSDTGPRRVTGGRVSPDGTYVAAVALGAGVPQEDYLVGLSIDGRQLWTVASHVLGLPAISPDGKQLAFAGEQRTINIYDIPTGELRTLDIRGNGPAWNARGDRIAYDDGMDTSVYDLTSGTTFMVGRGTEPSWSPDGESIAVRRGFRGIDLVNVSARSRSELVPGSSYLTPRWSPDGEWMAYSRKGGEDLHWWSLANVAEPQTIVIRQVSTGAELAIGDVPGKANPFDYTWVASEHLCGLRN